MKNNKYSVNIGIEIHVQLLTKTKMFSNSINKFSKVPNQFINEIDLGYPGALPSVNQKAIIFAIKLAKSLNMKIDNLIRFDRKHYFYPDLPKGYQITQQNFPIGKNGFLEIYQENKFKKIFVERIHLEEDTAKQIHKNNFSYLDFNRCGVPLIEIVSFPVIESAEEAKLYVNTIKQIVNNLKISDAKMEEGSLRVDVNISIKPKNQEKLGTKVEIKNINSINNVKKSIELEISEQIQTLEKKISVESTTKRFDDTNQKNIVMRSKKNQVDYRYIPESNILPIYLPEEVINKTKIVPTPWEIHKKLAIQNLNILQIDQLINNPKLLEYFLKINYEDRKKVASFLFAEIVSFLNKNNLKIENLVFDPISASELIEKISQNKVSANSAQKIIEIFQNNHAKNNNLKEIIKKNNFQLTDQSLNIKKEVENLLEKNIKFIEKFNKNIKKINGFLMGQIMKTFPNNIDPKMAQKIILEILKNKID